jgi:hypothetical protein
MVFVCQSIDITLMYIHITHTGTGADYRCFKFPHSENVLINAQGVSVDLCQALITTDCKPVPFICALV